MRNELTDTQHAILAHAHQHTEGKIVGYPSTSRAVRARRCWRV